MRKSIYIVEDDQLSREYLAQIVLEQGFRVMTFSTASDFLVVQQTAPCDLVLLDIGLPDLNGFEVTERITTSVYSGIILVTARTDLDSRVKGLSIGADAYLTKPVHSQELYATIVAILRRTQDDTLGESWTFDNRKFRLITPDNQSISLSSHESRFINILIEAHGDPVSREQVINGLGHATSYFSPGRLDTMVSRLRKKN